MYGSVEKSDQSIFKYDELRFTLSNLHSQGSSSCRPKPAIVLDTPDMSFASFLVLLFKSIEFPNQRCPIRFDPHDRKRFSDGKITS